MNKLIALAATSLLALTTLASAQSINPQGPLDADGDGFLTEEEFSPIRAYGANFVAYDSDGDGLLSKPEYNEGVRELAAFANQDASELNASEEQRYAELTRMFSNPLADRDSLLNLFGRPQVDGTATGSITPDGTPGVGGDTDTDGIAQ